MSVKGHVLLGNRMVPVEQIRSVSWRDHDGDGFIVRTSSAHEFAHEIDVPFVEAVFAFGRFIPAPPGFHFVHVLQWQSWGDDETVASTTRRDPIVAWAAFRGEIHPVTINNHSGGGVILCPDGSVNEGGTEYGCLDEWFEDHRALVADLRRLRDEREAREKGAPENPEIAQEGGP
jgi:hypothetical protein